MTADPDASSNAATSPDLTVGDLLTDDGRPILPEVADYLEAFHDLQVPDFSEMTATSARALFGMMRVPLETEDVDRVEDRTIRSAAGPIPVRIYSPAEDPGGAPKPAMVWFHGGGWVLGNLDSGEVPCRAICNGAGAVVVSVDYRLAPETPFPGAFDDCWSATEWVFDHAAELGVDPERISVGGDSAGANLAGVVAVAAHAAERSLVHQMLVYPVVKDEVTDSYRQNANGFFLTQSAMKWFWDYYVPDPKLRSDPRVSLAETDCSGLPSAFVMTCGLDPLCDEGQWYADRLESAGVVVDRLHVGGAIHGVFNTMLECGAESRAAAIQSLNGALSRLT